MHHQYCAIKIKIKSLEKQDIFTDVDWKEEQYCVWWCQILWEIAL